MRSFRSITMALALALGMAATAQAEGYPVPRVTRMGFEAAATGLDAAERQAWARRLARFAYGEAARQDAGLQARLHAVAVRLAPEDDPVRTWFAALATSQALEGPGEAEPPETLAAALVDLTRWLHLTEEPDAVALARYLVNLAAALRPGNEDIRFEAELVRYLAGPADWTDVLDPVLTRDMPDRPPDAPPDTPVDALPQFVRPAADIRLPVARGANTSLAALAARARPKAAGAAATVVFQEDPGEPALESLRRVVPVLRARAGTEWPYGHDAVIRMPGGPEARTLADLALGLMVASMIEGVELDPGLAALGLLNAEGGLSRGDFMPRLIRGAAEHGAQVLLLPAASQWDLLDAILLYPRDTLWTTQILGVGTFEEALAAARTDRPENLRSAMRQFEEIARLLEENPRALANPSVKARLEDVVALAPQHMSAHFLLLGIEGRLPRTLSLPASQVRLAQEIRPLLRFALAGTSIEDSRALLPTPRQISDMEAALDELRPSLHGQVRGLKRAAGSLLQAARNLHDTYNAQATTAPTTWRNRLHSAHNSADLQRKAFRDEVARQNLTPEALTALAASPR